MSNSKRALITGLTGQDGSYLAEHLTLVYEVPGLVRRAALEHPGRFVHIAHLIDKVHLHTANLESYASVFHVVSKHEFDECYHLAAQSFVAESFAGRLFDDEHQNQWYALPAGGIARAASAM